MKFNKYLAMCFLASTLMCGSFTSCGDDDDDDTKKESVVNDKTTAEQGREDGKNFGTLAKKGTDMSVTDATTLVSLASKYKSSTDKVYKTAFAEGAAETGVLGDSTKGDAAVETLDSLFNEYETVSNGTTTEKMMAIINVINKFKGNSSSSAE